VALWFGSRLAIVVYGTIVDGEKILLLTKEDLQAFHRYAGEKLDREGALSLVDISGRWP